MSLRSSLKVFALICLASAAAPAEDKRPPGEALKPGPWGEIVAQPIFLEPPARLMARLHAEKFDAGWHFVNFPAESIRRLFGEAGLTPEARETLLDESQWDMVVDGLITVRPPLWVLESLSPFSRNEITAVLRRWPENHEIYVPRIIESGNVRDWLANSGLSEEIIGRVERLSYYRGKTLCVSEMWALLDSAESEEEKLLLNQALSRTRAVRLFLRIGPDTDLESLNEYWSAGGRNTQATNRFRSWSGTKTERWIDIGQILPPLARTTLYRFNEPRGTEVDRDCYWTSMNFFRNEPMERFIDPYSSMLRGPEKYASVDQPLKFGDLLVIRHAADSTFIHMCVYVADNVVFTKNGAGYANPWILMRWDDVLRRYERDHQTIVEAARIVSPPFAQ